MTRSGDLVRYVEAYDSTGDEARYIDDRRGDVGLIGGIYVRTGE